MTLELQNMSMDGDAFRHWRKRHKLSQKDAAKALGLKPRIIQYYEKGERDGKTVEIPLSVRLPAMPSKAASAISTARTARS